MKYICKRTSEYGQRPCDEATPEVVTMYDCRTAPREEMAKNHPRYDFSEYENFTFFDGRAGCRKKMQEDAYTIEIDNLEQLMDFIKKYGDVVIIKEEQYDFPIIEIYDTWRE
jgi:hypothetical protein